MSFAKFFLALSVIILFVPSSKADQVSHYTHDEWDEENEWDEDFLIRPFACKKASSSQFAKVNQGNAKASEFLNQCASATKSSPWCEQLMRPNPSSIDIFRCTYGSYQVHQLIHPDLKTWKNAFQAVKLVEALEDKGIQTCLIYNWWRPEPYNANVGGAAGRHPKATSVDVRFCTMADMEKAFVQLCQWRRQGKLRALGYYGTTALHFGVGDSTANTSGKSCP